MILHFEVLPTRCIWSHMGISGGRFHAAMPQRLFDQCDRRTVFQRMSGVRVPHPMWRNIATDPCPFRRRSHNAKDHTGVKFAVCLTCS
jgi:hypothetical protein